MVRTAFMNFDCCLLPFPDKFSMRCGSLARSSTQRDLVFAGLYRVYVHRKIDGLILDNVITSSPVLPITSIQ